MPADDEELTDQFKAIGLADGFHDHDVAALARLTAAERGAQQEVRQRLYLYVDRIWDHVKAHSAVENPASHPHYSAVPGMRDLAAELYCNARAARAAAPRRAPPRRGHKLLRARQAEAGCAEDTLYLNVQNRSSLVVGDRDRAASLVPHDHLPSLRRISVGTLGRSFAPAARRDVQGRHGRSGSSYRFCPCRRLSPPVRHRANTRRSDAQWCLSLHASPMSLFAGRPRCP